ncbi:universal stress protein [Dactylosporangium sp. NPDC049140]|uniref:universal stress protein n=1 Tax=Dactylosporangium sp. NPDC049140 TaxID=3155647 RepID=UPI0033F216C6
MVVRERRIVVGVSQSLAGLAALRHAVREARHREAPLYAVRAWALPSHWRGPAATAWQRELRAEARRYVVEAFHAAGAGSSDLDVLVATPNGRADEVLVEAADHERDLLVLGGPGGRLGRWPGWIVRGCLATAACPVIVVPPPHVLRSTRRLTRRRLARELDGLGADTGPARGSPNR